jgi:hypothetical protein
MALTLTEIFAQINDPTRVYSVRGTLVVTQEDGRTGYLQSRMGIVSNPPIVENGQMQIFFSDRNRFGGNADSVGLAIYPIDPSTCRVTAFLNTWNSRYECTLSLPQNYAQVGKIYQGYGETIGGGSGRALHCLSFEDVASEVPPLG